MRRGCLVNIGDIIKVTDNISRKASIKPVEGTVCGIYKTYFVVKSKKGYRESFLKKDIENGIYSLDLIKSG